MKICSSATAQTAYTILFVTETNRVSITSSDICPTRSTERRMLTMTETEQSMIYWDQESKKKRGAET